MKILVVEDDPMVAMIHQEYCKKIPLPLIVRHASKLNDAVKEMREWQPNLVLLDNYLPDGKGIDYLEILKPVPTFQ